MLHRAVRRVSRASSSSLSYPLLSRRFSIAPEVSTASGPSCGQYIEEEYNDNAHPSAVSGVYQLPGSLTLERGEMLVAPEVAYTTYGKLNAARDNVIVLCHALTGHSLVHQYWDAMVTPEWTDKYFIVCSNVLGSCYGSTCPTSINPVTGLPYGPDFPAVTLRDAVALQRQLLEDALGVRQVQAVIGGSLGGMQTLEWAFQGQDFVKSFVAIACGAQHSAWQIGISELQRQAIYMDPNFRNGHYTPDAPPNTGLALARQIAMVSYRTHAAYADKFGRCQEEAALDDKLASKYGRYVVQSYLEYQGEKFLSRFDVNSYLTLLHMMDTHDVGRGRGGVEQALGSLAQPSLVIGIDSDVLYPLSEQQEIADLLPNSQFAALSSPHGHDGFLLGQEEISELTKKFLAENVE
ncbi:homoserine O-acetyltransferase [Phytophthora nicotianae CJ01A1]|uniref:Homoserine O-acetyltransferase n=3 Tax=Phytophthora nicotianae TaxID=4792 RepID=W2RHI7_PHYN3|nr:homoserine O-acetyltransferase [Phytophthora nicotianae INRA-310]ETN24040.1 homoserine O-acetyltransferase [Phytophthora nicotianae INRA-310]ETO85783.1 homoserine O-acetyltransferase [Phytophthora nicotianae P1976]ETP26810.1 homoserine O-acetyltransferase [Phytophthora nicotianae CJ01A1]